MESPVSEQCLEYQRKECKQLYVCACYESEHNVRVARHGLSVLP